ncbi:MAG: HEAT repeat domain-containing protein [Pirellulales bacterium]|nr:HEAT repeat domain-containing protein [Pirellulales bacterium]
MENLDQLLRDFRSDEADRCWVVSQLEEVPDERVVSLFVATLEDADEDEDVRIEILKSLVMRKDSAENHTRMGEAVLNVLRNNDDDLIRSYAAKALRSYPEVEGVLDCLESIVSSESEDIDLRHNALTAIETNRSLASYHGSLQRLVNVPELGQSAQRALDSV